MRFDSDASAGGASPPGAAPPTPIVASLGEPGGIGPELVLDAWEAAAGRAPDPPGGRPPPFAVVGDAGAVADRARLLGRAVPVERIDLPPEAGAADGGTPAPGGEPAPGEPPRWATQTLERAARAFPRALPVIHEPLGAESRPGEILDATAPGVVRSLERALSLVASGASPALVTLPIAKGVLMRAGFRHPGHTGWLSERLDAEALMLFVSESAGLRVALLTVHEPLRSVPARVRAGAVERAALALAEGLRLDFGVASPRIAVAGLNPHAGEGGAIGREDEDEIAPAVARLRAAGLDARGPVPADALFGPEARRGYDAALAMYHDQALAPFKALDFLGGAQVSLGLPIVRASPDHGTAADIAGRGLAHPDSLLASLRLAASCAARRRGRSGRLRGSQGRSAAHR